MDFSLTDEQEAIRDLARRILADHMSDDRLRELERGGRWFDAELWEALATANLTALTLPEDVGGSGFGVLEACLVLEEVGRHLAPVPLLSTLLLGGAPLAEFGSASQRERWLGPVARGDAVVTAALEEISGTSPARPGMSAAMDGDDWRLSGENLCVPAAELAHCILVPARIGDSDVGVFLVEPDGPGVRLERQIATNREPLGRLLLHDAAVTGEALLGGTAGGAAQLEWILARARVGLSAIQVGVAEEALRRTAEYTAQRKQFDRPIASFQSVGLRAADAFIDVECMRSTLYEAAWRLSAGRDAGAAVAVAKWWACRGGHRVVHTAQHLHGGIGSDVDYPIHRFFLWARQIETSLGGASQQLALLGELLVADGWNSER
ncbi:MAG: acyl-CoA dehydrogenase family protein [Myxococcota bacterium]